MTTQGAQIAGESARIAGSTASADAARDWQALRGDGDIQFAPVAPATPPQPPHWLKSLGELLEAALKGLANLLRPLGEALGLSWPMFQNILIALAALGAMFVLWRLVVQPLLAWRARPRPEAEAEWAPDRAAAVALLEDADTLAAAGRFGEATHLLLQRSVHHIAQARPDWLLPASTAREIAVLPMLPRRAREAFSQIATRVERSLFALRDLDAADWQAARAAYAAFALERLEHGAAGPVP